MKKPNTTFASPAFRQARILDLIKTEGEVRSSLVAEEFGVSLMTVWRDLEDLAEQGLIERQHGGARCKQIKIHESGFEDKVVRNASAKSRIAAFAVAQFLRIGDAVAMEGGTTVAALVNYLPEKNVSLVTNSLPVALRIRATRPALPLRLVGGTLSGVSGNTVGPEAMRQAESISTDVCFLGADALNATHGPMDPNPLEIEVKRAFAKASLKVVLLVDSSKFGQRSASVLLHPQRVHAIVTDKAPEPSLAAWIQRHGIFLVVAD